MGKVGYGVLGMIEKGGLGDGGERPCPVVGASLIDGTRESFTEDKSSSMITPICMLALAFGMIWI